MTFKKGNMCSRWMEILCLCEYSGSLDLYNFKGCFFVESLKHIIYTCFFIKKSGSLHIHHNKTAYGLYQIYGHSPMLACKLLPSLPSRRWAMSQWWRRTWICLWSLESSVETRGRWRLMGVRRASQYEIPWKSWMVGRCKPSGRWFGWYFWNFHPQNPGVSWSNLTEKSTLFQMANGEKNHQLGYGYGLGCATCWIVISQLVTFFGIEIIHLGGGSHT